MTITPVGNHQRIKLCIVAVLFAWTLWVFFPGSYSIDSWDQYKQMINGQYDDWFDGGMAFTWHILWKITGNYQSLYVMDMLMYWLFIALLLWRIHIGSAIFWVILAVGVFFCFIPQYVMRDSLMTLLWGYGALCLLNAGQRGRKAMVYWAVLFLAYGLFVRVNTLIALLPMVWICILLFAAKPLAIWKHLLFSLCVCAVLLIATRGLIYQVMHATKTYPAYKLKLLDITGISKLSGADYMPSCIRGYRYFNYDTLLANYTPADFDNIYWPPAGRQSVIPAVDAFRDSCVTQSWAMAVSHHPLFYLQNRLTGYLYYLRIRKRLKDNEYYNTAIWIDPDNPVHLQPKPRPARYWFVKVYSILGRTFIYSPWFWLLLNAAAFFYFIYCSRKKDSRYWQIHALIQLSGILYLLSMFPVFQSDMDFRLCYWNVFVTLIGMVCFFSRKEKRVITGS
jgi:hypothetical protein